LKTKLVDVASSYQNAFYFTPALDIVQRELSHYYNDNQIDLVVNKISNIFEEVDETLKNRITNNNLAYMSKNDFFFKFDNYTVGDIMELKENVVDTTYQLVSIVQTRIHSGMANNSKNDNNPFVLQDRQLNHIKYYMILIGVILATSYLAYNISDKAFEYAGTETSSVLEAQIKLLGIIAPVVAIVVVMSMMYAWYKKKVISSNFNYHILEQNTGQLMDRMFILSQCLDDINGHIGNSTSKTIMMKHLKIPDDNKTELYNDVIEVITILQKCNLITASMKELPFPWADVSINIAAILLLFYVMMTMMSNIKASDTIYHIKQLNDVVSKVRKFPNSFKANDFPEIFCETTAASTLRVAGLGLFSVVGIALSKQLLKYTNSYELGLYNSKYYSQSRCLPKQ